MTLWFETHATSFDNEAGLASGWYDVALSPTGEQQARDLGARRRRSHVAAVYCSDLKRAYHTAAIAFHGTSVPIHPDARLRECDYGALARKPTAEIEALRRASITTPFPAGESYEAVVRRVGEWLEDVTPRHFGETIVVIGHRATFYAFEHLLAERPLAEAIIAPWQWQPGWCYEVEPAAGKSHSR